MALKKSEKDAQIAAHPRCYICDGLGLPHSDFAAYEQFKHIQFDHWLPKGLVGNAQADLIANQLPVHAHPDGHSYLDPKYETSTRRNCHKGKGNKFSGQEWIAYITIARRAQSVKYSDDLLAPRDPKDPSCRVSIGWDASPGLVSFRDSTYPLMVQQVGETGEWQSFSTVVPPELLWTDGDVQSRPVDTSRLTSLAWHLRSKPLLTSILCRYSDNRLLVFDGNHRLCAFILAREGHPVPVSIFEGPEPKVFLEVVAEAHDELTQQKYQYSEKALKFSALNKDELDRAMEKYGDEASEKLAWEGLSAKDVKLRILGVLTQMLDEAGGWRESWKEYGLTDPSWNQFLTSYAKVTAESEPFTSAKYLRESETENLQHLCRAFDDELFGQLSTTPEAKESIRTKFWKLSHKRVKTRLAQVVRDGLKLSNTPEHCAYTPTWNRHVRNRVTRAAANWRKSPVWRNRSAANNEPDVNDHLDTHDFTENYLFD